MWLILLGIGVVILGFLAYLSWNYLRSQPNISQDVAPQNITTQTPETPVNDLNTSKTPGEIESPPLPRQAKQPENTEYFENSKSSLKGDLARNYRGFKLFYPNNWVKTPTDNNFLDISRKDGNGLLIEQMVVTYYNSTGLFSKDKANFPKLVEKSNRDLKGGLGVNYKVISEGETKIQNGRWNVYEVKFQSSGTTQDGKEMTVWGRRFWLSPQNPTMKNGLVITLLATSLSSEITNVDEVGNKGELASILENFEPSQAD
jgi:hypothetical protein